jgi:NAD-dependent DNA ligase
MQGVATMTDERLIRILQSKSPFTPDQISKMSDGEGWAWVYSHKEPAKKKLPEVCFTGFLDSEKAPLYQMAKEHGYHVVTAVTRHLAILCTGANPGPMKLQKAGKQSVPVLDLEQFKQFLVTGEIPITEPELVK